LAQYLSGCFPLCPERLAYPELLEKEHIYTSLKDLKAKLRDYCSHPSKVGGKVASLLFRFSMSSSSVFQLRSWKQELLSKLHSSIHHEGDGEAVDSDAVSEKWKYLTWEHRKPVWLRYLGVDKLDTRLDDSSFSSRDEIQKEEEKKEEDR
jgi:hypothetical protein